MQNMLCTRLSIVITSIKSYLTLLLLPLKLSASKTLHSKASALLVLRVSDNYASSTRTPRLAFWARSGMEVQFLLNWFVTSF